MDIGKPKNFQHILHAGQNRYSRSGEVQCMGNGHKDAGSGSDLTISSPTSFQHNLHGILDSETGFVVVCTPEEEKLYIESNCNEDKRYECNTSKKQCQQWRQDQIKIKVEAGDRKLKHLKLEVNDLRREHDNLFHKFRNAGLLELQDTSSSGHLGKHINYNIKANSVHFINKSNVTCEQSSDSDN